MAKRTELMHSTEYLRKEIQRLLERGRTILDSGIEGTQRVASDVSERLQAGADQLSDYYATAKKTAAAGVQRTDKTIRTHPYESLAIGIGIGILVGVLLRHDNSRSKGKRNNGWSE